MSQIFLKPENLSGERFFLDGAEAHHAVRVLRHQPGDKIRLFDGQGKSFLAELTEVDSGKPFVGGKILSTTTAPSPHFFIRLVQGLPKGSKFDFVVEKATELGVDEIHPFLSQKSVVHLTDDNAAEKIKRWTRLADAASKQCDRPSLPKIHTPLPLNQLQSIVKSGISVVFSQRETTLPLKQIFHSSSFSPSEKSKIVNLIVGPESGFSDEEEKWFLAQGALFASLGSRTLRTETAGLVALSILNYEFATE